MNLCLNNQVAQMQQLRESRLKRWRHG